MINSQTCEHQCRGDDRSRVTRSHSVTRQFACGWGRPVAGDQILGCGAWSWSRYPVGLASPGSSSRITRWCRQMWLAGTSQGDRPAQPLAPQGRRSRDVRIQNVKTEHLLRQSGVRAGVYAVVRAGGRQEKVEVGTIITMDRIKAKVGGTVDLAAVLLVDGAKITSEASALSKVRVTAEVLVELRGPKIIIQKFKNKTGYKKRQGHRQDLTRVKITGIK